MTVSYARKFGPGKYPTDEWDKVPETVVDEVVYEKSVSKLDTSKSGLYSVRMNKNKVQRNGTNNRRFYHKKKVNNKNKLVRESLPAKLKMQANIIKNYAAQINRVAGELRSVLDKLCSEEYLLEIATKVAEKEKAIKDIV